MPSSIDTILEEKVGEGPRGFDQKQSPERCPLVMWVTNATQVSGRLRHE